MRSRQLSGYQNLRDRLKSRYWCVSRRYVGAAAVSLLFVFIMCVCYVQFINCILWLFDEV